MILRLPERAVLITARVEGIIFLDSQMWTGCCPCWIQYLRSTGLQSTLSLMWRTLTISCSTGWRDNVAFWLSTLLQEAAFISRGFDGPDRTFQNLSDGWWTVCNFSGNYGGCSLISKESIPHSQGRKRGIPWQKLQESCGIVDGLIYILKPFYKSVTLNFVAFKLIFL